jgi:hypothetical protein
MDFFEKSMTHKGRFNSLPEGKAKGLLDVLKWKATSRPKPWPKLKKQMDLPGKAWTDQTSTTWMGHSTVLLKIDGVTILTDPVFSHSVGPTPFLGVKRKTHLPLTLDLLPPIDIILISHNHYDHLDAPSIKAILSLYNPVIVTPLNNGPLLKSFGAKQVVELDWWESHAVHPDLKITVTPALHWSRMPGSMGRICSGIEIPKNIFCWRHRLPPPFSKNISKIWVYGSFSSSHWSLLAPLVYERCAYGSCGCCSGAYRSSFETEHRNPFWNIPAHR